MKHAGWSTEMLANRWVRRQIDVHRIHYRALVAEYGRQQRRFLLRGRRDTRSHTPIQEPGAGAQPGEVRWPRTLNFGEPDEGKE